MLVHVSVILLNLSSALEWLVFVESCLPHALIKVVSEVDRHSYRTIRCEHNVFHYAPEPFNRVRMSQCSGTDFYFLLVRVGTVCVIFCVPVHASITFSLFCRFCLLPFPAPFLVKNGASRPRSFMDVLFMAILMVLKDYCPVRWPSIMMNPTEWCKRFLETFDDCGRCSVFDEPKGSFVAVVFVGYTPDPTLAFSLARMIAMTIEPDVHVPPECFVHLINSVELWHVLLAVKNVLRDAEAVASKDLLNCLSTCSDFTRSASNSFDNLTCVFALRKMDEEDLLHCECREVRRPVNLTAVTNCRPLLAMRATIISFHFVASRVNQMLYTFTVKLATTERWSQNETFR